MIVAAYLRLSGFFGLVALWTIRRATTPRTLLAAIIAAAGVLSALFVNDVVCLVLAPLVVGVTRRLALPPIPYLVALATAANVGSVATLTGNPQNMLVGSFSNLSYRGFLLREGPIALVAIGGAADSLFTRRVNPEKVYREVNWPLLVLFVGLFVLTGGIERAGLVDDLVAWAGALGLHRPLMLTVVTAILSNLVSNVPAVLLVKPLIPSLGEPDRGWLILAMASTVAGNLTILGSVANLIVVEAAREARVRIGFLEYCRVGVPLTALTLALGWLILIAVPV
jgi:Na+/H+ antiporter NhaD/arsenite permease-like protein